MRFLRALFGKKSLQSENEMARPAKSSEKAPVRKKRKAAAGASKLRARVTTDLKSFPFDVVGESHYQDALKRVAGGYRRDSQAIDMPAVIILDPENKFDPNAVRVEIDRKTVGFLPTDEARRVGALMRDQGVKASAVEAQVRGGWRSNQHDHGNFGVRLKMPRSGWIDFGVGAERPKTAAGTAASRPQKGRTPEPALDGPLTGHWVVLWGFSRDSDVAQEIASAGGKIMASIGKSTTVVVRDDKPITTGMMSSASWRKLEALRSEGRDIEMITWDEMRTRISSDTSKS